MAISGSFYKYPVGSFGLYCEWSAGQSATGNYSNVTLKTYLSFYTLNTVANEGTGSINGQSFTVAFPAINVSSASAYQKKLIKTHTVRVDHDSNGKKTGVKLSVSWPFYGTYSGTYIDVITASTTVDLTAIDRTAPTVSFSASNITSKGFKISATASTTCNRWDYSLDGGSTWTNFSTTSGTSASVTLSTLAVNTSYSVKVRARRSHNNVYGTSSAKSVKTLGYAIINSCAAFYADASTVKVKPNVTVYDADFTVAFTFKNGSTTLFTIAKASYAAGTADRTLTLTAAQRTAILKAMANDTSLSLTIVATTYDGSTSIGTSPKTVAAKTSSSTSKPTFSGFTFADTSDLVSLTGDDQILIQGYSSLKVIANTATAKNEASIVSYSATIGNKTVKSSSTEIAVGSVDADETVDLTVSAIDSRGYSTSVTKKVKVLPYAKPKLSSITLRRANRIDAAIQLSFRGTMSTIKPDGTNDVNGFVNVSYRYKETSKPENFNDDGTGYSVSIKIHDDVVRSSDGTTFSFATNQLLDLDPSNSFDFRIVIKDKVASYVGYFVIPKGIPLLAVRKDKLGINNPDPQYTLDVNGDINLTGDILINGVRLAKVLGLE